MMKVLCTRAADCESGATAMEYALIGSILSMAILTGADTVGTKIKDQFGLVSHKLAATTVHDAGPGGTSMIALQSPVDVETQAGTKVSSPRP